MCTKKVVTFGCPRVGDSDFARAFEHCMNDMRISQHWRVVNKCDSVPTVLPPAWRYAHAVHGVVLTRKGKLKTLQQQASINADWITGQENAVVCFAAPPTVQSVLHF